MLFKNLNDSSQTLQAEVNYFKEGQAENYFTNETKGAHLVRQQLGPSSKLRASRHHQEGSLAHKADRSMPS